MSVCHLSYETHRHGDDLQVGRVVCLSFCLQRNRLDEDRDTHVWQVRTAPKHERHQAGYPKSFCLRSGYQADSTHGGKVFLYHVFLRESAERGEARSSCVWSPPALLECVDTVCTSLYRRSFPYARQVQVHLRGYSFLSLLLVRHLPWWVVDVPTQSHT